MGIMDMDNNPSFMVTMVPMGRDNNPLFMVTMVPMGRDNHLSFMVNMGRDNNFVVGEQEEEESQKTSTILELGSAHLSFLFLFPLWR